MRNHIQGLEKEYGFYPMDLLRHENFKKLFFRFAPSFPVIKIVKNAYDYNFYGVWLMNMGRLYLDIGAHPEYSSPECATSEDIVVWQKAGDEIIMDMAERMNKALREIIYDGVLNEVDILEKCVKIKNFSSNAEIVRIYRNSIDIKSRNTYGEHENHIVKAEIINSESKCCALYNIVLLHLISRVIWQGSGLLHWNNEKWEYRLSQREFNTDRNLVSICSFGGNRENTLLAKPLICPRGQQDAHADSKKWHRLHIIGGDANMAEIPSRLKFGTVALLIQMLECGFFNKTKFEVSFDDLRNAYAIYSGDRTFRKKANLYGKNYSALDVQKMLFDYALKFAASEDNISSDVSWTISWWEKILDLLAQDNAHEKLARITDVSAKLNIIERDMKKYGYNWDSHPDKKITIQKKDGTETSMSIASRLRFWELEYHRLSRTFGIFQNLPIESVVSREAIIKAKNFPPENTRAFVRRAICEHLSEHGHIESIAWEEVIGGSPEYIKYSIRDPFTLSYEKIKK